MSIDSIGDFLTIIRNGIALGKPFVVAPSSNIKMNVAQVLQNEGFIRSFEIFDQDAAQKKIKIILKYVDGESVIHEITRRSRPARRYYVNSSNIKPIIGKFGISILTTNKGIMTDKQAKALSVGGEVICSVW
ncbi:MAG TPA: 30S ribosomal protein S8 [Candidatus Babeliales bacterium]|nr:30S ribosomal protein S8 [Candidatus Babeliales bacterium]